MTRDNALLEAYGRYIVGYGAKYRLLEPICKVLRYINMDVLDQFWGHPYYNKGFCVITGRSLCGAHPHRPYTLDEFKEELQRNKALYYEVHYGR
jgi:hypothetical protein